MRIAFITFVTSMPLVCIGIAVALHVPTIDETPVEERDAWQRIRQLGIAKERST